MKIKHLPYFIFLTCLMSLSTIGQAPVLINDPTAEAEKPEISTAEQSLLDKSVLPKARLKLVEEGCEESVEVTGRAQGAFTKVGAKQTLIFYQFCQTGNGLGSVGVSIIEDGNVVANFVSGFSGWSDIAKALPDVNKNGVDEIALYYTGGMHGGVGGTGVEILEVSGDALKGVGWYQAEHYSEDTPVIGYRVTVVPGKTPVWSREKYIQSAGGKWRRTNKVVPLKLTKVDSIFEAIK